MAKNGPKGRGRRGAVRGRKQFYNPRIKRWMKIDSDSRRIIDVKSDSDPFKGIERI